MDVHVKTPAFIKVTDLHSNQLIPANSGIQRMGRLSYSTPTKCWPKDKFLALTMDRTTTFNILADILFIPVLRLTEHAMAAFTQNYLMRYRRVNHRPLKVLRSNPFNSIRFRDVFTSNTILTELSISIRLSLAVTISNRQTNLSKTCH
jgi:hypothetical protein